MYSLVIDLEMCKVPKIYRHKSYKYATEIIQVGAVLLDEDYKEVDRFESYVHPEHGVIDTFIKDMTGINSCNVKDAKLLKEVIHTMLAWIGDREYKVYAWSDSDFMQLYREIKCKDINDDDIEKFMYPERWIDYQQVFGKRFDFKDCVSLEEALDLCDIEFEGRMHDGLWDAVNTASLIRKLELDNEYKIIKQTYEKETEPLGTCLRDVFAGLILQIA